MNPPKTSKCIALCSRRIGEKSRVMAAEDVNR
jgi:hypothetical protein